MMPMPARLSIGGNNPPSPCDEAQQRVESIFEEARHWLDGKDITTDAEAAGVKKLLDMVREAKKQATAARDEEKRPHDEAIRIVRDKYKPILDQADLIAKTCQAPLTLWLQKQEAQKKAAAEAARREADAKIEAARAAVRAASGGDLVDRAKAEALLRDANAADDRAARAERDKAKVKGSGRATSLRTKPMPELTDARAAAGHYWTTRREDMEAVLLAFAASDIREGRRDIPGIRIIEIQEAV